MADKNLEISLRVKLAGVKEVEEELKQLQQRLIKIIDGQKLSVQFDKIKEIDLGLLKVEKLQVLSSNVKEGDLKTASSFGDTGADDLTRKVGWKTAIQTTKMKALTPAVLLQMASRMMSLATAFSGFIGVLGGVGTRVAFNTVTKYTRTVTSALGELKTVVLSLTGLDKMFSVSGITNSMIAMADATKEIQKQALQTGIAVDALSQYRFAMKQVGVSAENFGSNIAYMGKAIVQAATGASIDAGNAFKKLKLDPKTLRLKDTQTQFEEIAKAISELPTESDKANTALLIFNRSGSQLLPFINKFNEGIQQSKTVLGQLPQIMRQYTSEFTQFSNNMSNLQIKGQQFIAGFMTQIVPSLNDYLQEFLKVDFTDFGKMFADNFQRTVASLNFNESWPKILNSIVLDLMDVVDKTLVKTTEYIGEALMALDWDKITAKILMGTIRFTESLIHEAFTISKDFVTGAYIDKNVNTNIGTENAYREFLSRAGVQDVNKQDQYIEKIYDGLKEQRFVVKSAADSFIDPNQKQTTQVLQKYLGDNFDKEFFLDLGQTLNENLVKNLPTENPEVLRVLKLLAIDSSKINSDEDRQKYNNLASKARFDNSLSSLTKQEVLYLNGLYSRYGNNVDFKSLIKELRDAVIARNPNADSTLIGGKFAEIEKNFLKIEKLFEEYEKTVGKDKSDALKEELLKYSDGKELLDKGFQEKLIQKLSAALEKQNNISAKAIADAQNELTKAVSSLERRIKNADFVSKVEADKHNDIIKDNTVSEEDRNKEQERYIKVQTTIANERLQAYLDTNKVFKATRDLLQSDVEWIKKHKEVNDAIKETTLLISKLASENEIAVQETLLKQFALDAERAERNVKSLKNSLNALKSDKSLTADNIKAIGGGYKSYIDSLYSKRDVLESKQTAYISSRFNKDLIDKTAREIEDLNNTIQQAINERNQWAQSTIVDATSAQVAQRNVELGQYEFKQLPEWAATNTQRYQYQMEVYDAQSAAAEENIEAIRKAKDEMLMLDDAVKEVKEAMANLSPEVENYDEKYAGLMNDLEVAKRNSSWRHSAGYRQLEQMEGQEGVKRATAKSRKFNTQNPEGFGHQISGSIKSASDQMGTLQQNVGQGFGNMIMSVRDSLSTLIGDLLNGTMTIGQAFQKLGQTILQSLISTFSQILVNFVMQQTVMRLLQQLFTSQMATMAAKLTEIWVEPATLASIASWGGAALTGSAAVLGAISSVAGASGAMAGATGIPGMAKGGRIKGEEQIIRVNEEGEEFIVSARSPLSNEPYLKLANMGYNLDSLFADQSAREISNSAGRLNIINNNKTERPQTNNNINIGMINSRQDKRRWMRKEGQRMIVDFLNTHRGALKYA